MFFKKGDTSGSQYFGPKTMTDLINFIDHQMGKERTKVKKYKCNISMLDSYLILEKHNINKS